MHPRPSFHPHGGDPPGRRRGFPIPDHPMLLRLHFTPTNLRYPVVSARATPTRTGIESWAPDEGRLGDFLAALAEMGRFFFISGLLFFSLVACVLCAAFAMGSNGMERDGQGVCNGYTGGSGVGIGRFQKHRGTRLAGWGVRLLAVGTAYTGPDGMVDGRVDRDDCATARRCLATVGGLHTPSRPGRCAHVLLRELFFWFSARLDWSGTSYLVRSPTPLRACVCACVAVPPTAHRTSAQRGRRTHSSIPRYPPSSPTHRWPVVGTW